MNTVVLPVNTRKRKQATAIGVAPPKRAMPILKYKTKHPQNKLFYDYHLLLNHASPKTILNTIRNPHLQMDQTRIPSTPRDGITCEPCAEAKLKATSHKRRKHQYLPGEGFSSDVAGPINFGGNRLETP